MQPTEPEISIKIFISYAREDRDLRKKLEDHLSSFKYSGEITVWQDQEIPAGENWEDHITTRLNEADLILLLVSASFIASKYCWNKEVQAALERDKAGTVRVVPIILKPVHWHNTPLGQLQVLPADAKPVTQWESQDAALEDVARGIRNLLKELKMHLQKEAQGSEVEVPFEGRKAALIVGVNNTQRPPLLPDLKFAEDDAHQIASILRTPACNFLCPQAALTGGNAQTHVVRRAVIQLAQQRASQDLLLFYFLGHALPIRTREGHTDIYLVTSDFDEGEVVEDATAYLSLRWLREQLYRSDGTARVLIILDCCYANPDASSVDISQLLKECIGHSSVMEQNGRWKVVLTASTYTAPVQERMMTHLLLSALQGAVREAANHKGYVTLPSLYTYLQTQMPQEHLPKLAGDFPQKCVLAYHPHFSDEYRSEVLQAEKDTLRAEVSKLSDQLSEVHSLVTDPKFFERIASPSAQSPAEYFDHWIAKNASLDDLHREKITDFCTRDVVQRQKDFHLGASSQDLLRSFGFLREMSPTYGALLCFGLNPTQWLPGASTRCILWSGNDTNNGWLDDQDYPYDLITQFESGRKFLQKHLRLTREIGRDERSEKLEIPLTALGEALANALVHREYMNRTASVSIDVFADRIEITNPGIPPEPMTLDLLEEEHKSHPRNPQIARIFYLHQYVEKVGSGIQRMQNALRNARLQPAKFELGKDKTFKVIFYRPEQVSSEDFSSSVVRTGATFGELTKEFRSRENISQRKLAEKLNIPCATIEAWERNEFLPKHRDSVKELALELHLSGLETELLFRAVMYPTSNEVFPEISKLDFLPRNPYKGLRPFGSTDADDFFGRETLVEECLRVLQQALLIDKPGQQLGRLLAVIGPSGSGKSSVVMAGVLPCLCRGVLLGSETWISLGSLVPGADPIEALTIALSEHFPERDLKTIREDLQEASTHGLHQYAMDLAQRQDPAGTQVVLVVDQFEELFIQTVSEEKRRSFLDLLITAITVPDGPFILILALRADFSDRVMLYPDLYRLIDAHHCPVLPMEISDLRRVIGQPATLPDVQVHFEEDLMSDLLLEIQGQAGALPLLQFTLDQLFQRRDGHLLTSKAYREIGGVKGALAKHAEVTYTSLPTKEHRTLARSLFLRLIDPSHTEHDTTRRRARFSEFELPDSAQTKLLWETIDTFIAARLLTTNEHAGVITIEVSHEALIREWLRLTDWLRETREDILLQQKISEDAVEWQQRSRPNDHLYRGSRLREARAWAKSSTPSQQERAFLYASVKHRVQRFVISVISIVLLLTATTGTAVWFLTRQPDPTQVTTTLNAGVGSLRWAVDNAPSGTTITFAPSMVGQTITLTDTLFILNKRLQIQNRDATRITIHNTTSGIGVGPGAYITMSDLAFTGGLSNPVALLDNFGTLALTNSAVSGNIASGSSSEGGGILNFGTLTLTNSIVSGNIASGKLGGDGGGIFNLGNLTLNNSSVSNNTASGSTSEGGGIFNYNGTLTVTNSSISNNIAFGGDGGGIFNNTGTLNLTNSIVSGNTASNGYGGGIFNNTGTLNLTNSKVSDNTGSGGNRGDIYSNV